MGARRLTGFIRLFNLGGGRAKRESVRMQAARRNCAGGNIVLQKRKRRAIWLELCIYRPDTE